MTLILAVLRWFLYFHDNHEAPGESPYNTRLWRFP